MSLSLYRFISKKGVSIALYAYYSLANWNQVKANLELTRAYYTVELTRAYYTVELTRAYYTVENSIQPSS